MTRRRRRQRREALADFIDSVFDQIYDGFCRVAQDGTSGLDGFTNYTPPRQATPVREAYMQHGRVVVVPAHVWRRVGYGYSEDYREYEGRGHWKAPRAHARPKTRVHTAAPKAAPRPSRRPPPPPPEPDETQLQAERVKVAYEILQLDPAKTTLEDLKKRRRALALHLHRDKGGGQEGENKLKLINSAYDVLKEHLKT